eukprot:g1040.t1
METSWSMKLERELLQSPPEASKAPVRLISADGETFVVEKQSAIVSNLIAYKLFHQPSAEEYPLPNVSGRILARVLEFCTTHTVTRSRGRGSDRTSGRNPVFLEIEKPMTHGTDLARYVDQWDLRFVRKLEEDRKVLQLVFYAANYLDVKPLFELICASVACSFVATTTDPPSSDRSMKFDESFNINRSSSQIQKVSSLVLGKDRTTTFSSAPDAAPAPSSGLNPFETCSFSVMEEHWWSNENGWLAEEDLDDDEDDAHIEQLESRLKMSYVCGNLFREFDNDGSNTLDPEELMNMLNEACKRAEKAYEGGNFTLEQAKDVVDVFDSDGDHLVNLSEFVGWVENLSEVERVHYEDSDMIIEKKLGTFFTALEKIADDIPEREAIEPVDYQIQQEPTQVAKEE